jgi:cell division protein FtsB
MNWSWLITLVCPLMMILMMFGMPGMRGMHGHGGDSRKQADVEKLQQELNELKLQNEQMRSDIRSITS